MQATLVVPCQAEVAATSPVDINVAGSGPEYSIKVQGFRIDLAWADQEWADKALATLAQVSEATGKTPAVVLDTSGPEIRVCNTAKACLRKQSADAGSEGVVFEEGGEVMLCRGGDIDMCSSAVPVDCSKTFTELAIEVGAVLHISSYLSAGACRP